MGGIYDVVVVGAGPAGSSTAYYLARSGLRVMLLDKATFPRDKTCGDCLTPRTVGVLEEMGLLNSLLFAGFKVYSTHIFAPKGHSAIAGFPQREGNNHYGLVVPRRLLDNLVLEKAQEVGADFQGGVNVTEVRRESRKVIIRVGNARDRTEFEGRLAVIATGANPRLLLQMGLLDQPTSFSLATRTYYESLETPLDSLQFYFNRSVPSPGYGWFFPVGKACANVGTCCFPTSPGSLAKVPSARLAFDNFVQTPPLLKLLAGSKLVGPVKGYPIRTDFLGSKTSGERVLLVGEAAGLVNPATGEGIGYALESGRLAAGYLTDLFTRGDLYSPDLAGYDRLLRKRFGRLFWFFHWSRYIFMRYPFLDWEITTANRLPELKLLITNILLGNQELSIQGLFYKK